MSHSVDPLENQCTTCEEGLKRLSSQFETAVLKMYERTEELIKDRELAERQRLERLLETVSEQLNKNVAVLFESIIQREIRTHVSQKIEKAVHSRIDQRMHELSYACVQAVSNALESKSIQTAINRTLKSGVVDALLPTVENGLNEMRLQVLEHVKGISLPLEKEVEQEEYPSVDSRDETLDQFVDSLRLEGHSNSYQEDPFRTVTHLLETNILEGFSYAVNAGDPDIFMFFLEKMPLDAEMDLSNGLLVSFIDQLVAATGLGWRREPVPQRLKYALLLNNALSHIQKKSLGPADTLVLQKSLALLLGPHSDYGASPEEQETLQLIDSLKIRSH
ncbi:hypothetical protein NEHOM01_0937 [Nematocida homosporus]|uniref:uncharacterized protein n=1 Tax=Nematocida homosporus TaxID=1912981 RepID=UPI00221E9C5A|nr:uncharacterized protein NEHOM01_0937 [Nematocida homosporus]KAI5185611.1 hypothetical protein NEHOM01_0937 [Nematocida homosporus]